MSHSALTAYHIITLELKNPLSNQTVADAIAQYRSDRDQRLIDHRQNQRARAIHELPLLFDLSQSF